MNRMLALAIVLCVTCFTPARAGTDPSNLIEAVMEAAGINAHLLQIANLAASEIEGRRIAMPTEEYERLRNTTLPAYAPAKLRAAVFAEFQRHFDKEKLERWYLVLQEPLMKDMRERERQAGSEQAFEQVLSFMRAVEEHAVPVSRLELIRKLDASTGTSEVALESQLAVTRSLLNAINAGLPPDQQLDGQRVARLLADLGSDMAPKIRNMTAASLLFAYRDVEDARLTEYLERYNSPEGRWVTEVSRNALRAALAQASPS